MSEPSVSEKAGFTLIRTFRAPQKRVFEAFSQAEALNAWWGPVASRNTVISLDFRPGGIFHYQMESGGGARYGRFLFVTIQPYDLLEFTNAFADAHAQIVRAPFDFPFPQEIRYRITLTETNGLTTLTLTGSPVDADPAETAGFRSLNGSMQQGFGATFDQLANYLINHSQ